MSDFNFKPKSWEDLDNLLLEDLEFWVSNGILLELPSPKEVKAEVLRSLSEKNLGYYIGRWTRLDLLHPNLKEKTFPFSVFWLTEKDVENLINFRVDHEKNSLLLKKLEGFMREISEFSSPFFIKIGEVSPKDCYWALEGINSAKKVLTIFSDSLRCIDHAWSVKKSEGRVPIYFRPFMKLDKRYEFRVIVKDEKIIGISQYYFTTVYNYTASELLKLEERVRQFQAGIHSFVGKKSYVVDLYLEDPERTLIIEINPYWDYTDPCLFRHKPLDGSIQVVKTEEDIPKDLGTPLR